MVVFPIFLVVDWRLTLPFSSWRKACVSSFGMSTSSFFLRSGEKVLPPFSLSYLRVPLFTPLLHVVRFWFCPPSDRRRFLPAAVFLFLRGPTFFFPLFPSKALDYIFFPLENEWAFVVPRFPGLFVRFGTFFLRRSRSLSFGTGLLFPPRSNIFFFLFFPHWYWRTLVFSGEPFFCNKLVPSSRNCSVSPPVRRAWFFSLSLGPRANFPSLSPETPFSPPSAFDSLPFFKVSGEAFSLSTRCCGSLFITSRSLTPSR